MRLHTAGATPFGRTVEIVAHELGLNEDMEVVRITVKPTDPNRGFQALNPLRRVPTLELEDGEVIVDSAVIVAYLAARVGDTALFADNSADRWRVASRYAIARGATECAVSARYEVAVRPQDKRWPAWSDDMTDKIDAALTLFEATPPAPAGRLTIDDIALGALLGYLDFRFANLGWRGRFPGLVAFMEPLEARDSFRATVPA